MMANSYSLIDNFRLVALFRLSILNGLLGYVPRIDFKVMFHIFCSNVQSL